MVVKYGLQEYECAKAIKGNDYVYIFDEKGNKIVEINGITDFTQFTVIDGVFDSPEPSTDDYLLDLDYRLSMIELGL